MTFNPELLDNVIPPPGTTYKSSNKFHKGFSVLGLLIGIVFGIGIGWLYGLISFYNPLIYINFLILIGAVLGVAFSGMITKHIGKSRNMVVDMVTVFFIGFFSWYSSWVYFYADQKSLGFGESLLRFGEVIKYAIDYASFHVMTVGRAGRGGIPVPGGVMFLFYVIELGALMVPVWMARKHYLTSYFCEGCNKANSTLTCYGERNKAYEEAFLNLRKGNASYFAEAKLEKNFQTIRAKQLTGDFASLDEIKTGKAKSKSKYPGNPIGAYRLEFNNCLRCKNNPIIDVYNGIIKSNDKDELEFTGESELVRATYIDEKGIEAITKGLIQK
jgi:hypothetical protein